MRPFRYSGTVTASQVVSSFVSVGAGLAEARETAQMQLEAEEKKKGKVRRAGLRCAASLACCLVLQTAPS